MPALLYIMLLLLFSCAQPANPSKTRPDNDLIIVMLDFANHEQWQEAILKVNRKYNYNIVFLDSAITNELELLTTINSRHAIGLVTDKIVKTVIPTVNPLVIRENMIKQIMPSKFSLLKKSINNSQLCKNGSNWLIDLPLETTINILRKIPRNCGAKNIWSTANIKRYKTNAYLQTILKNVKIIPLSEAKLMQICFQQLKFNIKKMYNAGNKTGA